LKRAGANESDTVLYLIKLFEEVLGYDALKGEISKEVAIKDRYCDMAIKIDGAVRMLGAEQSTRRPELAWSVRPVPGSACWLLSRDGESPDPGTYWACQTRR
jgi:hypothetical protein